MLSGCWKKISLMPCRARPLGDGHRLLWRDVAGADGDLKLGRDRQALVDVATQGPVRLGYAQALTRRQRFIARQHVGEMLAEAAALPVMLGAPRREEQEAGTLACSRLDRHRAEATRDRVHGEAAVGGDAGHLLVQHVGLGHGWPQVRLEHDAGHACRPRLRKRAGIVQPHAQIEADLGVAVMVNVDGALEQDVGVVGEGAGARIGSVHCGGPWPRPRICADQQCSHAIVSSAIIKAPLRTKSDRGERARQFNSCVIPDEKASFCADEIRDPAQEVSEGHDLPCPPPQDISSAAHTCFAGSRITFGRGASRFQDDG